MRVGMRLDLEAGTRVLTKTFSLVAECLSMCPLLTVYSEVIHMLPNPYSGN